MSGENKEVKYKQAIPLINKGEWVLVEEQYFHNLSSIIKYQNIDKIIMQGFNFETSGVSMFA